MKYPGCTGDAVEGVRQPSPNRFRARSRLSNSRPQKNHVERVTNSDCLCGAGKASRPSDGLRLARILGRVTVNSSSRSWRASRFLRDAFFGDMVPHLVT